MSKGCSSSVHIGDYCQQQAVDELVLHERFLWVYFYRWIDAFCSFGSFVEPCRATVVAFYVTGSLLPRINQKFVARDEIRVIYLMMPADLVQDPAGGLS
jgi:hypothetical protein